MATGRTVRGLAGLIGSDDSTGSEEEDCEALANNGEPKSVFDVPAMFNAEVRQKLREGEQNQLQTAFTEEPTPVKTIEVIEVTDSPPEAETNIRTRSKGRKRHRDRETARQRHNYISLLESSDDDANGNNRSNRLTGNSSRSTVINRTPAFNSDVDKNCVSIGHGAEAPADLSVLCNSFGQSDSEDEADQRVYRIMLSQIGTEDVVSIVRLTDSDKMEIVFKKAEAAVGMGGILMMGAGDERREVLAEDTPESLSLSTVGLTRMEFVPMRNCVAGGAKGDSTAGGFTIKFITGNRRETKEIRCGPDERLECIFNRYCSEVNVKRTSVMFKFDDEVLDGEKTPEELDIDSGDLVEVHISTEDVTPSGTVALKNAGDTRQHKRPRRSCVLAR